MGNVYSTQFNPSRHYKHSGFSSTILSSYSFLNRSRCLAWYEENLFSISSPDDGINYYAYKHSGFSATVLSSVSPAGGFNSWGIGLDTDNLISVNAADNKVYLYNGFSNTVSSSFTHPNSHYGGAYWDGSNLLLTSITNTRHYKMTGFSSTISDSYASPSAGSGDLSMISSDVISSDYSTEKHYKHNGFSATILSSYTVSQADTIGIAWESDISILTSRMLLGVGV